MRVVTWNVRSLRDDRDAVAAGLRSLDADVVCLQEVPRFLGGTRSWHRLARDAGLEPVVGGRSSGAVAILVRPGTTVLGSTATKLSRKRGLHQRGLAVVQLESIAVATTHLDLDPAERLKHAHELLALLPAGPCLLAGDLNENPDGPVGRLLATHGLVDVHDPPECTFPAGRADVRIDVVLTDVPARAFVPAGPEPGGWAPATDHLPLVAEL